MAVKIQSPSIEDSSLPPGQVACPRDGDYAVQFMSKSSAFSLYGVVALACACVTDQASGIRITGKRLDDGFQRWTASAPPQTRAKIKQLQSNQKGLIHLREGKIDDRRSRGTASLVSPRRPVSEQCPNHPPSEGIDRRRNWDLVYDPELHRQREVELQFPSTLEALLHHEIMGHIVPALERPEIIDLQEHGDMSAKQEIEQHAIEEENNYRRAVKLPLIPWTAHETLGE